MFRTLYSRMLLYSLVLSLGGILFVGAAVYLGVQESFSDYIDNRRDEQISQVVEIAEGDYSQNGAFTNETQAALHRLSMQESIMFLLYSADGEILTDTSMMGENGHMGRRQMGQRSVPQNSGSGASGPMAEDEYELTVNNSLAGTLVVMYPDSFAGIEGEFFNDFSRYLLIALAVMTVTAIILSMVFSRQLTKGIKNIGVALARLKYNRQPEKINTSYNVKELQDLSAGVNELAESLERGERLRKQFTSDMAHELRTPLSTLRSQLESFQDGVLEPTPERLQQSYDELMRLVRLVNEMEQLHAAENPGIKLNIKRLEAGKMLESIYDRFEPSFMEKGITLDVDTASSHKFSADPDRFIQIMTNLLNNAWKFTPEGKKVTVTVTQDGAFTRFQVADEGKGLSVEEKDLVFERFYRGEKSRNRELGGLGIGLSIVKALTEAQNGKVSVGDQPGGGAVFTVSFPNAG